MSIPAQKPAEHYGRYRTVSPLAVASVIFGLLSIVTVLHWSLGVVPAIGILLGWLALRWIKKAPEERTGRWLAIIGLLLSLAMWTFGYGRLLFAQVQEVPYGYERLSYEMLQPDPDVANQKVPPEVFDLQDKKVFIKGYISPGRQQLGLKRFIVCPAIPDCPFCTPNPKPTEMVRVTLQGDLRTDYTTNLIRLGGKFSVDPNSPTGMPYGIEADYLR